MNTPIDFTFFCTASDYPKFFALFKNDLPPTYAEFVAAVDASIKNSMEQVTVKKAYVSFDEFLAFCAKKGEAPNIELLGRCAFLASGRNGQG